MVKGWWDGSSDGWSSEKDYMAMAKDYKPVIDGQEYVCLGRQAFGDGDCMHVFRCKTKKKGDKTMACYAHSDYTLCVALTNEDQGKAQGSAMVALQSLMEAYKEAGY